MKKLDYDRDLEINPDDLENEWLRRGHKFMSYAEALAEVEEQKNNAKDYAQIIRARIAKRIRLNYLDYDYDSKPTDKAIKDEVELDKAVINADREVNALIRRESVLKNAVKEMGSYRRAALENLTAMRLQGYSMAKQFKVGRVRTGYESRRRHFEDEENKIAARARHVLNEEPIRRIIRRKK